MKVQIFFVFLLVLLSNVASADYLECYVCEDCEENEAHLEYCSPIEEIQSALKPDLGTDEVASTTDADEVDATVEETNSADNTTAFTHLAIDAGNATATDLDSTKVGVTANSTSATITQTTNSATGINDTTLTNSTATVLSSVPLATDEEDPENSSDIDDNTISNQTTAGTFTTNGINSTTEGTNQTALGTEISALSTLNTTETTKITESMAEGTTKNVTVNNGTATGEVVQTTIEIMEANATTLGEDMMVAQTNKTSTVMQSTTNTTGSKESFANMELDHENSTFIEDNALETTTLENSTVSNPNEINTPLKNETAGHETTINFTISSNSTVSPFIDINITDVPGLTVTTSEVVANTTNFARPNGTSPISNITAEVSTITNEVLTNATNGNFGNTTSMEDSNEVEISNQTVVEIGYGSGRPNGTSQIGTVNGNFENTSMEDSNEVEISNQTIVEAKPESARPNSTSQIGTGNGIGFGSGRPNGTSQIGTANENFGNAMEDSDDVEISNQTIVEAQPESARPNSTSQIGTGNGIGSGSGRPNGTSQIGTANKNFGNTTLIEDSNVVDTSNQTAVGARPESGRPNSTSQIGIANGNFGSIASIEDSNEIEMNNQTSAGTGLTRETTVSSLVLTNSTHFAVENTTTAGRPNSTLHIAIDSGNITSMDEFNNQTLSNETAMGTKPIGEVTASSLVTTNTTNTILLNATDMPNQTGSTNGVLTNTKTVDGLQGASQTGVIGGNFGNITVDISEELNGTKQVNIKAPDLQQMPGTTNVHISSTTAAANSNGTREAFPTEEGMEGLLETNSVNFQLMEVPNGITQAEINSASSIKPSNTNGVLQLTTAEASILDGNLASKGDSSSSLFATEKEKLLPKTLKHSRSTLSKINTDKEVFNTKKATAVSEVQRDALRMHQANEFKFARDELKLNPARFIQHKYSRIGNAAGVKLGNITYKCYSVRVKGKNKVQLNKGCVAVPAEKNACELLAAKYGKEALVDCEICVKGKCNRSSSIGLKLSQKSLALIMLLGWLLGGILS